MPFQAVSQDRLYERVARQVADLVARGELRPGERLPAERDLSKRLGVSRPTLREAMIALEIAGLVEVRMGAGVFVREKAAENGAITFDAGQSPFELLSARRVIEPEIAAIAAGSVTSVEIGQLEATIEVLAAAVDYRASLKADADFHAGIARMTGNAVFVSIVEGMWNVMQSPLFDALAARTGLPDHGRMTVRDHRDILTALKRRDAAAARGAMRAHLGHVEDVLSDGGHPATEEVA